MLHNIFCVPLYHSKIENWSKVKLKIISLYDSIKDDLEISKTDPVLTNYYNDNNKIVSEVVDILGDEIKKFMFEIGINDCNIKTAWFEKSTEGNYHIPHNHGSLGYSSVCYISYDKLEHTPTQFISPFNNFITGDILKYSSKEIDEGSLIFFPSSMIHYTNPNKSKKDRLVLSFNLKLDNPPVYN
jgi:hypothetical protein